MSKTGYTADDRSIENEIKQLPTYGRLISFNNGFTKGRRNYFIEEGKCFFCACELILAIDRSIKYEKVLNKVWTSIGNELLITAFNGDWNQFSGNSAMRIFTDPSYRNDAYGVAESFKNFPNYRRLRGRFVKEALVKISHRHEKAQKDFFGEVLKKSPSHYHNIRVGDIKAEVEKIEADLIKKRVIKDKAKKNKRNKATGLGNKPFPNLRFDQLPEKLQQTFLDIYHTIEQFKDEIPTDKDDVSQLTQGNFHVIHEFLHAFDNRTMQIKELLAEEWKNRYPNELTCEENDG